MSTSERIFAIVQRVALILFMIVAAALLFWIGQSISTNFARQALIEEERFGSLREDLDEDFSGDTIAVEGGEILIYEYSKNQDLDRIYYDQASDITIMNAATGQQRKISGDDRKVIWFRSVRGKGQEAKPSSSAPRASEVNEAVAMIIENTAQVSRDTGPAFAYVARLATRDMYKEGVSDLVVGNFKTFEQKQIAADVPYVEKVMRGPEEGQVSILYWVDMTSARHVIVDTNSLNVVQETAVALPEMQSFLLDLEDDQAIDRDEAIDRADAGGRGRPRQGGPGF